MIDLLVAVIFILGQALPEWDRDWQAGQRQESLAALEVAAGQTPALAGLLAERLMAVHHYQRALAVAVPLGDAGRPIRGACLYLLGRYDEALVELPGDDPLTAVMRVDALVVLGRHQQAWQELERAGPTLDESQPAVHALRGRLLAASDQHDLAAESFSRALQLDPLELSALFGLGRSLLRLQRTDEARALLEEHRRLTPLVDAYDAAVRAVDLSPSHAANHALLGDCERNLGRLQRAAAAYAQAAALAQGEDLVPVALRQARLLADDLNDLDAAVACLDGAAQRVPDSRLRVRAGDLLARARRWHEAADRYGAALALRPDDAQVQSRLQHAQAEGRP